MTYEEMVAMPLHSRAIINIDDQEGKWISDKDIIRVPGGWLYMEHYGGDKQSPVFVPEAQVTKIKREAEGINLTAQL